MIQPDYDHPLEGPQALLEMCAIANAVRDKKGSRTEPVPQCCLSENLVARQRVVLLRVRAWLSSVLGGGGCGVVSGNIVVPWARTMPSC